MKQNKSQSAAKKGMNKDAHASQLQEIEYISAINANTENESGEGLNIGYEPSNYLCTIFPEGYKVIGFANNQQTNQTFFLLHNPTTRKSSVGYIENTQISPQNVEYYNQCTDCTGYNQLGVPLEEITQMPFQGYVELFNDNCLIDNGDKGLNFSLNFPVKNIVIKNEKGIVTGYWDDYNNPSRYCVFSNVEYLFTEQDPCDDPIVTNCLKVDRLLHFPKHSHIKLNPDVVQTGGNLKMGTYEYWAVYCDAAGNSTVNYSTPTNPIKIFDENNNLLEQTELDSFTNFAIKIKVEDLDSSFSFYKVVCVERTSVDGALTTYVVGVYPTSDNTVLHTSSGSNNDDYLTNGNARIQKRLDNYELYRQRPIYEKAKVSDAVGNMLWKSGLKQRETLNLQPVVNLFGSLLKWNSTLAKEDLYKSAIATSKYVGYPRDEVKTFGIRFKDKWGGVTPVYPLIGRPVLEWYDPNTDSIISDVDVISDTNYTSLSQVPSCVTTERNKRWQIHNTARELDVVFSGSWECPANLNQTIVNDNVIKTCKIESVNTLTASTVTLTNVSGFSDLQTYIEENPDENIAGLTEYLQDEYPASTCTPLFNNCDTPTLLGNTNEIGSITNETYIYNQKSTADYQKNVPVAFCQNYLKDDTGALIRDTAFENDFMPCSGGSREVVYKRNFDSILNENSSYPVDIVNNNDLTVAGTGIYHNYYGSTVQANLLQSSYNVNNTDSNFLNKLHKGALWFKAKKLGRNEIALEITKNAQCTTNDDLDDINKLRYTIYDTITGTNVLGGNIVDTTNGTIDIIDTTLFPNEFYVAVDAPMYTENIDELGCPSITFIDVYKITPPCGCFSIFTRDVEYSSIDVSWDSLTIDKYQKYEAECQYFIPRVDSCDPVSFAVGEFSYWESIEEYPANKELYDSSELVISPNDLSQLTELDYNRFEQFYVADTVNNTYVLKDADFRCQKIRHFKTPSNQVSPFTLPYTTAPFAESLISPLAVTLDDAVVRAMISVAVNNSLITQEQADNITDWELVTGDSTLNKSIVASGLAYDMYKYQRDGKDVHYPNFPFNDLGKDQLHYTDSNRNSFISHPFDSEGNNKFSVLSPDLVLNKPTLPTEMTLSGYLQGNAKTRFTEVKSHPKWTILGKAGRTTADILAIAESTLESLIKKSEFLVAQWNVAGVGSTGGSLFAPAGMALASFAYTTSAFARITKYRYEWLKIFRDLGTKYNFANYSVAEGFYNNLQLNTDTDNIVRGLTFKKYLKEGDWQYVDEITGEKLYINNYKRERSALVGTGDYNFNYSLDYIYQDNADLDGSVSSRTIASQNDCSLNTTAIKNIGSPYVTLKNYIPDQWGTIDSIKWLTTNYSFNINDNTKCTPIFGGSYYISRFTYKRKVPIFRATALGQADTTPVEYYNYKNIGYPRYYCDYETDTQKNVIGVPIPDIDSNYSFDCQNGRNEFYLKPNSKFYLYYYGIVDFLVESEINCNFRHGKKQLKDQFYPQVGDVIDWTQEVNLPIAEPNTFYYNSNYSLPVSNSPYTTLDRTYSKELWSLRDLQNNAVIYSEHDNSQNDYFDPWRVYKPLNWYEFDKKQGELKRVVDVGNSQVFVLFEDGLRIFNAVDNLADRILNQNRELGTGGIFTTRPLEFVGSGSQNTEVVVTPYGSFFVDAKRGKVNVYTSQNIDAISETIGGQPTNMKNWFRENLPFKIKKYIPNIDTDNKFKGLGINMWFDYRFDRLFITKKDVVVKPTVNPTLLEYNENLQILLYDGEEISIDDPDFFEDASWTIAFKIGEGWISFYSFYPNYTVSGVDYFQTGYNNLESLWSHIFSNSSFLVFQGNRHSFSVDLPVINQNVTKTLDSLAVHLETKRHQNAWDYSLHPEKGYNKTLIYNPNMNSHNLELIFQDVIEKTAQYPITEQDRQKILYNARDGKHMFNYFYNRLRAQNLNIPHLLWDKNRIFKEVNTQAVSFKGKPVLEQLRGDYFTVSLINDNESRFNTILKRVVADETIYE